jgi:tetratricopeptide (TPR) repeat protein
MVSNRLLRRSRITLYLSPADAFPPLKRPLEQALALDPELNDALAMRGLYRMLADRDWSAARADLHASIVRAPNSVDARLALALFLAAMGEFDAALVHADAAVALYPLAPPPRFTRAWCLYRARRYRASVTELEAILELQAEFPARRSRHRPRETPPPCHLLQSQRTTPTREAGSTHQAGAGATGTAGSVVSPACHPRSYRVTNGRTPAGGPYRPRPLFGVR